MKRFGFLGLLSCVLVLGMSGCASKDEVTETSTAPKTSVPGQDISGAGGLTPSGGPGGGAAKVRF